MSILRDLRQPLTERIEERLRAGKCCVVIGGPRMGKTHLSRVLGGRFTRSHFLDGVSPDVAMARLQEPEALLITLDVDHYGTLAELPASVLLIRLVPVSNKDLPSQFDDAHETWRRSAGHPFLAERQGTQYADAVNELQQKWRGLLETNRAPRRLVEAIIALPTDTSPADRFEQLRRSHDTDLQRTLDWLCCAGMISRYMDLDRPALEPVPGLAQMITGP